MNPDSEGTTPRTDTDRTLDILRIVLPMAGVLAFLAPNAGLLERPVATFIGIACFMGVGALQAWSGGEKG